MNMPSRVVARLRPVSLATSSGRPAVSAPAAATNDPTRL